MKLTIIYSIWSSRSMCTDNLMQLNKLAHISICNNNQRWCVRVRNQVYRINCPPCKSNCACVRGEAKLINSHCALFIFGVKANVLRGRERANLCCDWELVLRVPCKILLLFSLGGLLRKMSVIEFSFDSEREEGLAPLCSVWCCERWSVHIL
jgi:hypothetical protein